MREVRTLVVGDLMLDHYIWGSCERISPEAPVQVVKIKNETKRLGGAGNVVLNLLSLGAKVGVMSVLGDDETGDEIERILCEQGARAEFIKRENPAQIAGLANLPDDHFIKIIIQCDIHFTAIPFPKVFTMRIFVLAVK